MSKIMTPAKIIFSLSCLFLGELAQTTALASSMSLHQDKRFIAAQAGENVTLRCFYKGGDSAWLYWYKQTLGHKPRLISLFYVFDTKITFKDEFQNSRRFNLSTDNKSNHLTILNLQASDSATYYCACSSTFVWNFTEGTIVSVRGSSLNIPVLVKQSGSEIVEPGGSLTLNCTVQTGTCDGEHRVYWFKNSEESNQEIIYSHSHDQCERREKIQTHTCVYNLPMKSLQFSNAGTYYCAVVSCGHIVFGNGTELNFEYEEGSLTLVYLLSTALTITTILVVSLAVSVFRKIRRNCPCTELKADCSAPSTEGSRDMENLHYAALSVHQPNGSRRQRSTTKNECVYSSVKL